MSELFVDLRPASRRAAAEDVTGAMESLVEGLRAEAFETPHCLAVVGRVDRADLWGPYRSPDGRLLVALGGRLAFEEKEWQEAEAMPGDGGLACKAVAFAYQREGAGAFGRLNGNFGVFVHDDVRRCCYLATDRFGAFLLYGVTTPDRGPVFGSHPDLVARFTGCTDRLDRTSMAEFLQSGRLTFPFTHYESVRSQEFGVAYRFDLAEEGARPAGRESFWEWRFAGGERADEEELAGALATAFQNAVRRRSLTRLGRAGIGLSGG
ncbi:MAG TPA: hypothetical protein VNO52_01075, partial [Methylomirabilota bacterium]|nr:hypothetical protein [Methylomirabilota bacterium]